MSQSQILFSVKSDVDSVRSIFFSLSNEIKDKMLPFAVNQVGNKAFTFSVRKMSAVTGIPQKNLRHGSAGLKEGSKPIMTKRAGSVSIPKFEVKVRSRWLHISESYFNPVQNKTGVSTKYYNARRTFEHAFLAKGKNSQKKLAFLRTSQLTGEVGKRGKKLKKYKLKAVWAFNPAREFMKDRVADDIINTYAPMIPILYEKKLLQSISRRKMKLSSYKQK
jgi:hypothetical protein